MPAAPIPAVAAAAAAVTATHLSGDAELTTRDPLLRLAPVDAAGSCVSVSVSVSVDGHGEGAS